MYAYAARHYPDWAADFPALAPRFVPGSMGENLSIAGLDEDMVCIGDHIAHGSVVLQVTQPRLPCFKLALAFGNPKLVRAMTRSGRSGWYYRVLVPGALAARDPLTLIERPNPAWTVTRFNALLRGRPNVALCAEAAALTGLSAVWRAELTQ